MATSGHIFVDGTCIGCQMPLDVYRKQTGGTLRGGNTCGEWRLLQERTREATRLKGHKEKAPNQIAEAWYSLEAVQSYLSRSEELPPETDSTEFAEWLVGEFRAAMTKGIQIGRGERTIPFSDEPW